MSRPRKVKSRWFYILSFGILLALVPYIFKFNTGNNAREESASFLDDLISKRWSMAYARTIDSEGSKMGMDKAQFAALMGHIARDLSADDLRDHTIEELPLPFNPPRHGIKCFFITFPRIKALGRSGDMLIYAHRTGDGWHPSLADIHLAFLSLASSNSDERWDILLAAMKEADLREIRSSSEGGFLHRDRIEMYKRGEIKSLQIQTQHSLERRS